MTSHSLPATPTPSASAGGDPDINAGGLLHRPPHPGRYDGQNYEPDESTGLLGAFLPLDARVLDVGCGSGSVSQLLREHRRATLVGVEPNPTRAALGRERGLDVRTGFLTADLLATLGSFDAVVFADVLEHLADPAAMLRLVRPALKPGGVVVASMPNMAHWSVRAGLLLGRFNYRESGIMDATHLRWFTYRTVRELFERSGFVVTATGGSAGQWMPEYRRWSPRLRRHLLPRLARGWPALFACQLVVQARVAADRPE
jgi:SAM-dependent methyltransferase